MMMVNPTLRAQSIWWRIRLLETAAAAMAMASASEASALADSAVLEESAVAAPASAAAVEACALVLDPAWPRLLAPALRSL